MVLNVRVRACPDRTSEESDSDRTSDPLPLRGVPRRGEGCNRSARIILERTSKLHTLPINRDDTSLKGGGFAMTLIFLSCILHLNLKVLKLIIAERIPIIQNRTTIFDSSIPFNSK